MEAREGLVRWTDAGPVLARLQSADTCAQDGCTPLLLAAMNGNIDATVVLVELGAHLDERERVRCTVLRQPHHS